MADETDTTGEVARVLAEASGCTWQRIPEPEHPYGRHCLKADLDEHPDVGYCWVQPRKQAAMLAEAGLLRAQHEHAWISDRALCSSVGVQWCATCGATREIENEGGA